MHVERLSVWRARLKEEQGRSAQLGGNRICDPRWASDRNARDKCEERLEYYHRFDTLNFFSLSEYLSLWPYRKWSNERPGRSLNFSHFWRGAYWRGALISKFSKIEIQISHVRLKIKYHPYIFEKCWIFNRMLRTKWQSTFERFRTGYYL